MNERLASLPITHVLFEGSVIWPQSKNSLAVFPRGILATRELPVALVPKELTSYRQRGQVLFVTPEEQFDVYYPKYKVTHTYYPPWILFGFSKPDNNLTVTIFSFNHPKKEYKQGALI